MYVYTNAHAWISALYSRNFPSCVCVYVCECVCVCISHTYIHGYTRDFFFVHYALQIVNKMYILSHDMRKYMVSERGGGAEKTKQKKKKKNKNKQNKQT